MFCWENPATNVIKLAVVTHVSPCLSSFALLNSCKYLCLFIESVFRHPFGRTHNFIACINSLTSLPEVSRAPPWGGSSLEVRIDVVDDLLEAAVREASAHDSFRSAPASPPLPS